MPIYEFRCQCGTRTERFLASSASRDAPWPCQACGKPMRRVVGSVSLGGRPRASQLTGMPASWRDLGNGDPDTIRHWRKRAERQAALEARNPELRPPDNPVLAHEGSFEGRPLRVSDVAARRRAGHERPAADTTKG